MLDLNMCPVIDDSWSYLLTENDVLLVGNLCSVRLSKKGLGTLFLQICDLMDGTRSLKTILDSTGIQSEIVTELLVRLASQGVIHGLGEKNATGAGQITQTDILILVKDEQAWRAGQELASYLTNQCKLLRVSVRGNESFLVSDDKLLINSSNTDELTFLGPKGEDISWPEINENPTCNQLVIMIDTALYSPFQFKVAQFLMPKQIPHVLVCLGSQIVSMGPLVIPGQTSCVYCRAKRRLVSFGHDQGFVQSERKVKTTAKRYTNDANAKMAASYLFNELAMTNGNPDQSHLINCLYELVIVPPTSVRHTIWKVPNCSMCSLAMHFSGLPPRSLYTLKDYQTT